MLDQILTGSFLLAYIAVMVFCSYILFSYFSLPILYIYIYIYTYVSPISIVFTINQSYLSIVSFSFPQYLCSLGKSQFWVNLLKSGVFRVIRREMLSGPLLGKSQKKGIFLVARPLRPPPQTPSSLVATFLGGIFLELQKKFFFFSGQALIHTPLSGRANIFFCGFP